MATVAAYGEAVRRDMKRHQGFWSTSFCCLFLATIIMSIILIATSIRVIDSTQIGLKYDTVAKELGRKTGPGMHNGPPFFVYLKFPSVYRSLEANVSCVSNDGLPFSIDISYQYILDQNRIQDIALKYRDFDKYERIMMAAAEASIHWTCSQFLVGDFQSLRGTVQNTTKSRLQKNVNQLYATILDVQLRNVAYPPDWAAAIAEKEKASYDITLAENERAQALARANGNLQLATQTAAISLQNATTQANVIATQANFTAQALIFQYQTQADVAGRIKQNLNLTTEGLLAYLMNRAVEGQGPRLDVAIDAPAKAGYADEL